MGSRITAITAIVCATLLGCDMSQKYRVRPDRTQAQAISELQRSFMGAVEGGDPAALAPRIDLEGRLALLQLTEWLALEKHGPSREVMLTVATVLGGEEVEGAFTTEEVTSAGARVMREKLVRELELDPGDEAVLGLFLRRMKLPGEEERLQAVMDKLSEKRLSGCRDGSIDLGVSAGLLDYLSTPDSRSFAEWRSKLRSAHLASVECGDRHGLVLFTFYGEEKTPRLAAWQFFDDEQWEIVRPKLEKLLPRSP